MPDGEREYVRQLTQQMHGAAKVEAARRPHEVVYDGHALTARGVSPQPRTRICPRRRGAGRPAARVARRGGDSGDSDGLDGESEPPSERGAA